MVRGKGASSWLCAAVVLCAAFLLVPGGSASASSCASPSAVKSYSGTGSLSFTGSKNGVSESISISHSASGITSSAINPDSTGKNFRGSGHGGIVNVKDSFTNTSGTGPGSGKQTATGAINGSTGVLTISFSPASCTYAVKVSYQKNTHDTSGFSSGNPGVTDEAQSNAIPIPSSLALSGDITVQAYPTAQTGSSAGYYDFGSKPAWADEMAKLNVNGDPDLGPATLSWNLTPTFKPPCSVPALTGDQLETARLELQVHNCTTGTITKANSSTIPQGDVISSNPPAGSTEPNGTKVALVISSGPVKTTSSAGSNSCVIPKLRRHKLRAAKRALRHAHCGVGKVTRKHSKKIHKGRVISAKPRAGTKHIHGYRVSLVVSKGK